MYNADIGLHISICVPVLYKESICIHWFLEAGIIEEGHSFYSGALLICLSVFPSEWGHVLYSVKTIMIKKRKIQGAFK
jgi:hypothetical protein